MAALHRYLTASGSDDAAIAASSSDEVRRRSGGVPPCAWPAPNLAVSAGRRVGGAGPASL